MRAQCSAHLWRSHGSRIDRKRNPANRFESDIGKDHTPFEKMLEEDEKTGKFRRKISLDEIGHDTPYVYWHPKRPYFVVPKDPGPLDPD